MHRGLHISRNSIHLLPTCSSTVSRTLQSLLYEGNVSCIIFTLLCFVNIMLYNISTIHGFIFNWTDPIMLLQTMFSPVLLIKYTLFWHTFLNMLSIWTTFFFHEKLKIKWKVIFEIFCEENLNWNTPLI